MMTWDDLAAGNGCSLDRPRAAQEAHWEAVATLSIATLYLPHNQTYRGHCILVFDPRHATRLEQLDAHEWLAFADDLHRCVRVITTVCAPDHFNVASLGNVMPHLHWHLVPRYKNDPRWGAPIWSADLKEDLDRRLTPGDRARLLDALRGALRHG